MSAVKRDDFLGRLSSVFAPPLPSTGPALTVVITRSPAGRVTLTWKPEWARSVQLSASRASLLADGSAEEADLAVVDCDGHSWVSVLPLPQEHFVVVPGSRVPTVSALWVRCTSRALLPYALSAQRGQLAHLWFFETEGTAEAGVPPLRGFAIPMLVAPRTEQPCTDEAKASVPLLDAEVVSAHVVAASVYRGLLHDRQRRRVAELLSVGSSVAVSAEGVCVRWTPTWAHEVSLHVVGKKQCCVLVKTLGGTWSGSPVRELAYGPMLLGGDRFHLPSGAEFIAACLSGAYVPASWTNGDTGHPSYLWFIHAHGYGAARARGGHDAAAVRAGSAGRPVVRGLCCSSGGRP